MLRAGEPIGVHDIQPATSNLEAWPPTAAGPDSLPQHLSYGTGIHSSQLALSRPSWTVQPLHLYALAPIATFHLSARAYSTYPILSM